MEIAGLGDDGDLHVQPVWGSLELGELKFQCQARVGTSHPLQPVHQGDDANTPDTSPPRCKPLLPLDPAHRTHQILRSIVWTAHNAMAPHAGFDTEQVRDKARKDLLYLLEGVSSRARMRI